jgi:hypothetical protein
VSINPPHLPINALAVRKQRIAASLPEGDEEDEGDEGDKEDEGAGGTKCPMPNTPCPLALSVAVRVASRREGMPNAQCPIKAQLKLDKVKD